MGVPIVNARKCLATGDSKGGRTKQWNIRATGQRRRTKGGDPVRIFAMPSSGTGREAVKKRGRGRTLLLRYLRIALSGKQSPRKIEVRRYERLYKKRGKHDRPQQSSKNES